MQLCSNLRGQRLRSPGKRRWTFQPESRYQSGWGARDFAVGDLNHDGRSDVVLPKGGSIAVFLGQGDGTLRIPQIVSLGVNGAYAVAIGDVNGDSHPDIVSCGIDDSRAFVLSGDGSGNFAVTSTFVVGSDLTSLTLGDFDRDGDLDAAICPHLGSNGQIVVARNDGLGHFSVSYPISTASAPATVATDDFNRDGNLDLAVTEIPGRGLSVYLGVGDGTFGAETLYPMDASIMVTTGDLDGDGAVDLIRPNIWAPTGMTILMGNGDGTFQMPSVIYPFASMLDAALGDLNNDGVVDCSRG